VSGDRRIAELALLAHPLVGRQSLARPLLEAILEANRPFLPRFFS
jgi:alpha-galactosidase/6-phospho-beta-glucosidase family protein